MDRLARGQLGIEMRDRGAALGLGQHDRVGTSGHDRVEIGIGQPSLERIDAHHQGWAGLAFVRILEKGARGRARGLLAFGRDRVLEIEDERVRLADERLGELRRAVAGHEQRGAQRRDHCGRMRMNAWR